MRYLGVWGYVAWILQKEMSHLCRILQNMGAAAFLKRLEVGLLAVWHWEWELLISFRSSEEFFLISS